MSERTISRPQVRLPRESSAPNVLGMARVKSRILKWLGGLGHGRPRSSGEIRNYAVSGIIRGPELRELLEEMAAPGELVAVDGVPAENLGGDQRPFRGYALPRAGEGKGGAA